MNVQTGAQESLSDFSGWEDAKQVMRTELAQAQDEQAELYRRIEQSRTEVEKMSGRNRAVTSTLQKVQSGLQDAPREEIRAAYDNALDTLQRLFTMRNQLDKMETEHAARARYISLLEGVQRIMEMGSSNEPGSAGSFATVEMMIRAQEAERQRLSRQMHDGPAQTLSNFILQTEIATRFFDVDHEKARGELQTLKADATETFQQVRDFIFNLRPMMLDDLGAVPTVRRYVDSVKTQSGVEIEVLVTGAERRLESYLEVIIFRSIQELLETAISNGHANEIRVQIDLADHEVRISVDDNGKGFEPELLASEGMMGIRLIKDRAEMLGGHFEIDSAAGQGARITFRVPISRTTEVF